MIQGFLVTDSSLKKNIKNSGFFDVFFWQAKIYVVDSNPEGLQKVKNINFLNISLLKKLVFLVF